MNRILSERLNFLHIKENRPYKSQSHQKAVENYSFELLTKDLSELKKIRKYREIANSIIKTIKDRDIIKLLELMDKLEDKLNKEIKY